MIRSVQIAAGRSNRLGLLLNDIAFTTCLIADLDNSLEECNSFY